MWRVGWVPRRPGRVARLAARIPGTLALLTAAAILGFAVPAAHADTTGPTLVGGNVHAKYTADPSQDETRITLYFDEELDPAFVPLANDDIPLFFQIFHDFDENGPKDLGPVRRQTYDSVQVKGKTLILLDTYSLAGNVIHTIEIADTTRIRDLSGNQAEAPAGQVELVNMIGLGVFFKAPGAPQRAATDPAVVDGSTLTVKFDQTLAPFTKVAGTGGFTISGAASATAVTHVEGHATSVALTLDREVGAGETGLTLGYQPGTPVILNLYDEKLAAFTGQAVANARADTTAPTLVADASTISGTDVRLRFSEAMNAAGTQPAATQFELDTGTGGTDLGTVSLVSIAGSVIRLSTQHAAATTDTVTLTVTNTTNIRDLAGNAMASVSGFALTNTGGTAPGGPALAATNQAVLLGNVLTLTFDQMLDPASVPPASAFSVSGAFPAAHVDAVAIDGAKALLTLRKAVPGGARGITVSYAAGQGLQNLWGEAASGIDGQAVRVAGPDATPPALVGAAISGAELTLTFDEPLDAGSEPLGSAFAVWTTDWRWVPGSIRADIQNKVVTVTLAATAGSWREVWYAPHRAGGSPLQDAAGNEVPGVGCWGDEQCTHYAWGPRLVSGLVSGQSMALRFSKALDESSVPEARAFSVTVDDAAATPGNIAVSGFEVTMELPSAAAADAVVKVGFSRPTGIRDLDGREAELEDDAYTLTNLTPPEPALPVLAVGDARAEEGGALEFAVTLSAAAGGAVTVDYATADGTATAGADYTAASGTLAFAAGETAKTVAVAALADAAAEGDETFTLTLSNASGATIETAAATGTVGDVAPPLTASFEGLPASHDGRRLFGFEIVFSEEFDGFRLTSLAAGALSVANGRIVDAKRTTRGQNRRATVRVRPASDAAMTLTLSPAADCASADSICTSDGRPLSASVTATVAGPAPPPPSLAVADASAPEGSSLSFAVTLDRAAAGTVTVDWATADGTATAGTDYTAASGTLTFAAGETSKTVSVQALSDDAAEDDERFALTLSNASGAGVADGAATGTVVDVPPLTASFANLPAEHDGSRRFGFEIVFSEEFDGMRLTAFAAGALTVGNGRLIDAKRVVRGENRRVAVRVRPASNGDLTLSLASAADCGAADAICAKDGRRLSNTATATVRGPALLSVNDVEATEGDDESVVFTVSLNRAAAGTATVDYATADRQALAGEDYTAVSGTLTFAAGETAKTVSVPLLDDVVDDDGETFALELDNARGSALGDRVGLATIRNSDPVPKAWLVRFARAATDHAVDAVQARFDDRAPGSHATFGGHRLWASGGLLDRPADGHGATERGRSMNFGPGGRGAYPAAGNPGFGTRPGGAFGASALGAMPGFGAGDMRGPSTAGHAPAPRDLLVGSSFLLSLAGEDGGGPDGLTAWGSVAGSRFDGMDGAAAVDGEVATYLAGADVEWNRWLGGVALVRSVGRGGFRADTAGHQSGELDSSLTAVHPYLRWQASDRLSAWGMIGYGAGTLDLVVDPAKPGWTTDTAMRMAAGGMRGVFARASGMELAAKLDARLSHITSKSAASESGLLGDTAGGTSRIRLALEGTRAFAVGASRTLTPTLELGLRRDGGDAETGAGVDLGGTLRYADAGLGLTAEASARHLLAHEDAAYREWGASALVRVDPGASGRGLSLSLMPSWGAMATGGAERLWSLRDASGLTGGGGGMDGGMRLEADIGYGFERFRGRGAMRPFLGARTAGPSRDWRAGVAWSRGRTLEFGFEAVRRESPAEPPAHAVELRLRWTPAQRPRHTEEPLSRSLQGARAPTAARDGP